MYQVPNQVQGIYGMVTSYDLQMSWTQSPGEVHDYRFELAGVNKDGKPFNPQYAGDKQEVMFDKLEPEKDYMLTVYAVLWYNGIEQLSSPLTYLVSTGEYLLKVFKEIPFVLSVL